ncbi:MAG: hypothetical protein GY906_04740 [bacterium]|nr:hypothetical protein [bacterium]
MRFLALTFALLAAPTFAADVSQNTLADMGLGNLQPIAKAEASEIQGKGTVFFGRTWVRSSSRVFSGSYRTSTRLTKYSFSGSGVYAWGYSATR